MNPNFFDQFLHKYPYSNLHELNLDWLIAAVRELAAEVNNFELVNQFTYEGNWDITKQYKKFAIVTVNGTEGYISLQPVPAGVNITNGDYWAMIADYTAVIGGLGARILALENAVADLDSRIGIDFESVVWIGDSYTSAGSLGSDVDKRFSTLVSSYLGLTEYNYAVGGTGFKYGSTPYTTQIANAIADFIARSIDQTKTKYVMIIGNRNDADAVYSYSDYVAAIQSVISSAKGFFTNAKIIIIPGLWDAKPCKQQMIRYCSIIEEVVNTSAKNVYFYDNAWTWLQGQEDKILYQNGADVHPNVVGHSILASHIIGCLEGNNYNDVKYYEFVPTSVTSGITDCLLIIQVVNNIARFQARFHTSSDTLSGTIISHVFNSLVISNLFIIDTQVYTEVKNRLSDNRPMVTVNQVLSKTDDTTGSLTTSVYCYGGYNKFDTTNWNWIEFEVPYGIKRTTYN